jgi:hypothetical protein
LPYDECVGPLASAWALLALLSTWLWLGCCPGGPTSEPGLRNLVLICFDTVRFDAFPHPVVAIGGGSTNPRMRSQSGTFTLHRDLETPLGYFQTLMG